MNSSSKTRPKNIVQQKDNWTSMTMFPVEKVTPLGNSLMDQINKSLSTLTTDAVFMDPGKEPKLKLEAETELRNFLEDFIKKNCINGSGKAVDMKRKTISAFEKNT